MLISDNEKLKQDIQSWMEKYGSDRSALIPILQQIQINYQYITEYAMQVVADVLEIHPVEVYGVVSFYSFLDDKPRGKFIIRLCRTISCDMLGKDNVARQLENDLGIDFGQTTDDGVFTLDWASCLGMCDKGPAMLVNEQIFTHVTPEKVHDILNSCRKVFTSHMNQVKEGHIV